MSKKAVLILLGWAVATGVISIALGMLIGREAQYIWLGATIVLSAIFGTEAAKRGL